MQGRHQRVRGMKHQRDARREELGELAEYRRSVHPRLFEDRSAFQNSSRAATPSLPDPKILSKAALPIGAFEGAADLVLQRAGEGNHVSLQQLNGGTHRIRISGSGSRFRPRQSARTWLRTWQRCLASQSEGASCAWGW